MSCRRASFLKRLSPPRLLLVRGVVKWALVFYALALAFQGAQSLRLGPELAAGEAEALKPFLSLLLRAAAVAYGLARLWNIIPPRTLLTPNGSHKRPGMRGGGSRSGRCIGNGATCRRSRRSHCLLNSISG